MASNKLYVDLNLNSNEVVNFKADTLDINANLASAHTKRIVYYSGQYYYSDGTSWIALGNTGNLPTGGATGDILAKASGTDYDVEWISNYTSTVQHEVKAGVAITKGQAVYVSSADGTNMIVSKASNASEATSSKTMGLAASTAALNDIIFVITEGLLTGTGGAPLDTSSATAGDPVWLGTDGNLLFGLANKPVAPAHLVFIGIVTRSSATVGEIFVKVQNGFELGELHNVDALNPNNNDGLFYNSSNSLWEHKSIATALGYTPANKAGETFTGNISATNLSGTNTGDETQATIKTKLGSATTSLDGYLTSTDWNTFNNKQNALGFTPANIAGGTFIGDIFAENLTGNNSGDETLISIKSKLGQSTSTFDGWLSSTDWNTFNYKLGSNGIWRGSTFRNNSTTIDTTAGITLATSGTNIARSISTTSYATRNIRMGVTASIVSTGRYSGMRGSALLWYVSGGFLFTGEFNISDTAFASGTHNFWGLASSTSDLVIGDIGNSQPSALTNIIAFANDSGDANLQIMHNNASGTATKIDLGASFPANRTAGAAITTIYSCYLYNAPNSSEVNYRIINKETGAIAQGTIYDNLPSPALNFFGVRTMGTSGGGVTNSGQFDVYRLGVYSL